MFSKFVQFLKSVDDSRISQFIAKPRFGIAFILFTNLLSYTVGNMNGALLALLPPPHTAQHLPIGAYLIIPPKTGINLEVAKTPIQQELGLMYRPALPSNYGMLFTGLHQPVSFWMKNTPVPLDILFLQKGVVKFIKTAPPCKTDPCFTYTAGVNTPIDQVIELRSGRSSELGIKKGDLLRIDFIKF